MPVKLSEIKGVMIQTHKLRSFDMAIRLDEINKKLTDALRIVSDGINTAHDADKHWTRLQLYEHLNGLQQVAEEALSLQSEVCIGINRDKLAKLLADNMEFKTSQEEGSLWLADIIIEAESTLIESKGRNGEK